jgi:hypothetical protein
MPALPLFSDVDLLGHRKRVVDLDPEITHSAQSSCGLAVAEPLEGSRSFVD